MLGIIYKEFFELIKGYKSIILIGIMSIATYVIVATVESKILMFPILEQKSIIEDIFTTFILVVGYVLVFIISHHTINQEVSDKTIRFLTTKTSRSSIIFGKYLAILIFWAISILITLFALSIANSSLHWSVYLPVLAYINLGISICILFSLIISKTSYSILAGFLFSLSITCLGIWSMISDNKYTRTIKYITPNHYVDEPGKLIIIVLPSVLIIFLSIFIFKRRDL